MGNIFDESASKKDELKMARHLAFQDFYDNAANAEGRNSATKVVDTLYKLELEQQKADDETRLKEELNEHQMTMEEQRFDLEKEKFEFEKEKALKEDKRRDREFRRDCIKTGADITLSAAGLWIGFKELMGMIWLKDQPRLLDRLSFDSCKRLIEKASRMAAKIFRR